MQRSALSPQASRERLLLGTQPPIQNLRRPQFHEAKTAEGPQLQGGKVTEIAFKPLCGCKTTPCPHFPNDPCDDSSVLDQYDQIGVDESDKDLPAVAFRKGNTIVKTLVGDEARQFIDANRSAVELAMRRTGDLAAVVDNRNPVQVEQGQNPYIALKEKTIDEVISSKYSLRRGLIRPERGRMLVARTEWDEKLGSIFLPEGTKDMHTADNMEIVVMACGANRIDPSTGRELHMQYEPDDTIGRHAVIRSLSGIEFIWYDENGKQRILYLIGQAEIWGWLEAPPGFEQEMANSPELQRTLKYIKSGLAQKALPAKDENCICGEQIENECPLHGIPR
jgi:hypothetical protein